MTDKISYTCGFRPSKSSVIGQLMPFAHITGNRLGLFDTFDDDDVMNIFKDIGKFSAKVIEHGKWRDIFMLHFELDDAIINKIAQLDVYAKPDEFTGFIYKWKPSASDIDQPRLAHISVGKSNDIFTKVPIGTVIEFTEAFIKKEGPHDPEIKHVVRFE
ncbi:putative ORFan [Cotonvirus japonicus]|uniref:ORFan n=1 Tax=Cotonvirus japonicus TaxID=2811091 RepID=A0ABM7NRE2_9VIRU|nr:putative ORFan [Cotonvirus japonicus]BCS82733.1 putative ORFan [Cotonvirus japonicus]